MRGKDDETGEFLSPSRSQNRREALEVLSLGEQLVALTEAQLARLPVPESLLPHIRECKRITATTTAWHKGSSRVLEKVGMRLTGEHQDPDMGKMLVYEIGSSAP